MYVLRQLTAAWIQVVNRIQNRGGEPEEPISDLLHFLPEYQAAGYEAKVLLRLDPNGQLAFKGDRDDLFQLQAALTLDEDDHGVARSKITIGPPDFLSAGPLYEAFLDTLANTDTALRIASQLGLPGQEFAIRQFLLRRDPALDASLVFRVKHGKRDTDLITLHGTLNGLFQTWSSKRILPSIWRRIPWFASTRAAWRCYILIARGGRCHKRSAAADSCRFSPPAHFSEELASGADMMPSWNRLKRVLGYFPRAVWRLAWCRQRGQTEPVKRGESRAMPASPCGHRAPRLQIPAGLDPGVAAAIRQSVEQARERFLSGIDLAPLAAIAERAKLQAMVAEQIRPVRFAVYSVVYPREP